MTKLFFIMFHCTKKCDYVCECTGYVSNYL